MPIANVDRTPQCEYRHKYMVLPRRNGLARCPNDRDATFVDDLIESVGNLGQDEGGGWKLLRVKVYEDTAGRRWIHAYLKRQIASADESPGPDPGERSLPRAA